MIDRFNTTLESVRTTREAKELQLKNDNTLSKMDRKNLEKDIIDLREEEKEFVKTFNKE